MIVAIGNIKGGVGKTTIAVNLVIHQAIAGRDVLLVDGDDQGTAAMFSDLRAELVGELGYTCVRLTGAAIRSQVRQLAPKYEHIIIDVGGRDTGSLRAALTVADRVVIPVQPRSFDIWALGQMSQLLTEARMVNERLDAVAVLSGADYGGRDNAEALEAIQEIEGIRTLPDATTRRKAYPNAAAQGRSVIEAKPVDPKAVSEIDTLSAVIFAAME